MYLNTTLFSSLTADLYGYRMLHPEFPDQPTKDQFFDEQQFEAYRELGFQTMYRVMCDAKDGHMQDVIELLGMPDVGCRQ